jgi:hypothetical protein
MATSNPTPIYTNLTDATKLFHSRRGGKLQKQGIYRSLN